MRILTPLVDSNRAGSPALRFRLARQRLFRSLVEPMRRPIRILDVGGTEAFWQSVGMAGADDVEVITVNLDAQPPSSFPNIAHQQGDARDLSRFADRSFDVVFSNSLIEHVGGLDDQRAVAREIRRLGHAYFVQTPNRNFPLEPHFVIPFFQFLPISTRVYLLTHFDVGWWRKIDDPAEARAAAESIRLLDRKTFAGLFPDATLWEERAFGLVKSFVAYGGFPAQMRDRAHAA